MEQIQVKIELIYTFSNQHITISNFFIKKFREKNNETLPILVNLFKDYAMRSNSKYPLNLWNIDLKKEVSNEKYIIEIELILSMVYPNESPQKNIIEPTFNKYSKFNNSSIISNKSSNNKNNANNVQKTSKSFSFSGVDFKKNKPVTPRIENKLTSEFKLEDTSFEEISESEEDINKGTEENGTNNEISLFEIEDSDEPNRPRRLYTTAVYKPEEMDSKDVSIVAEDINQYTKVAAQIEPIVAPNFVDEEENEGSNIIFEVNQETKEKNIEYLSINLFLKKIALEKFCETNRILITGFVEQYTSFLKIDVLVKKIINAFNHYKTKEIKVMDLLMFLNQIIIKDLDTIKTLKDTYKELKQFYNDLLSIEWIKEKEFEFKKMEELFQEDIEEFDEEFVKNSLKERKKSNIISVRFENTTHKKANSSKYFDIFIWKEDDIAKQLTYISYNLLSNIEDKELISAKFAKKNKEKTSKNVLTLIERFDQLIYFIIEDIYAYDRKRKRAEAIEKWIKIAVKCKEINNFNDCMIITTAFCNYLIKNLKLTWLRVGNSTKNQLEMLKKFCNCQQSYINMKLGINQCIQNNKPYLPYLGLLLKEITSYEEKMQYIKDNTLINFKKIEKVANCLQRFFQFKRNIYNMRPIDGLGVLEYLNPKSEDDIDEMLPKLEPKFILNKKKNKKIKRLTKTDISYYNTKRLTESKTLPSLFKFDSMK